MEINTSNKKLDALIFSLENKLIDEIHLLEKFSEFNYTEVFQKRTGRKLAVPNFEALNSCIDASIYIGDATISNNVNVIKAVEELKIGNLLEWFTEAGALRNEFNLINSSSQFRIIPFDTFNDILFLNKSKVLLILINHHWPSWRNSSHHNLFAETLVNMEETKKNRIRSGKLPFTDNNEHKTDKKLAKLNVDFENAGIKQNYKDLLKGNIDSPFIRNILDKILCIKQVSERQKNLVVFPLLKLILKDRHLLTEKEFYSTTSPIHSYEDYMNGCIRNLLKLK